MNCLQNLLASLHQGASRVWRCKNQMFSGRHATTTVTKQQEWIYIAWLRKCLHNFLLMCFKNLLGIWIYLVRKVRSMFGIKRFYLQAVSGSELLGFECSSSIFLYYISAACNIHTIDFYDLHCQWSAQVRWRRAKTWYMRNGNSVKLRISHRSNERYMKRMTSESSGSEMTIIYIMHPYSL